MMRRWNPVIVGVTGSIGKSSFLSLLEASIARSVSVCVPKKGNSETGFPLEILGLRTWMREDTILPWIWMLPAALILAGIKTHKETHLIAEMGIDSPYAPKNMEHWLRLIRPTIGVLLEITPAHTEQFSALFPKQTPTTEMLCRAIANEKGKLVTRLPSTGVAILNTDSRYVAELVPNIKAKIVTVGWNTKANWRVTDWSVSVNGTVYEIKHKDHLYVVRFAQYALPRTLGVVVAASIATAVELGVKPAIAVKHIQEAVFPPGRATLIQGKGQSIVLDSSYNSSPIALHAFLDLVPTMKVSKSAKWHLVLGDMRELGPIAKQEHQAIASQIIKLKPFLRSTVFVGPLMKSHVAPAVRKAKIPVYTTALANEVQKILRPVIKPGDIVLMKGSQNTIYLEVAVKDLMKNPTQATELLCRQSADWERVRSRFFKKSSAKSNASL